ncbi:(2E,6E)-farnesyl diphosphate synthase [Thiococcus pfennigii]|jgi:farnesyl diphosphate synthase|uniref:(2E,6E)-farnesyl diphosphate synthase n=1 Tax=Thiococcus pfennigii TaxID=1057 RepID=UPI001906855E|nr:farnesyl diphosphate synthase [Thiococcus pfennigii]MBK1701140.1 (2E,6E)-farnesyl diphosphate synthase [Thiococcus pfennigii]MBK1730800.1 (2E,6E)-farnesyl diphosphate synthase [Thiococcus pfennigii]
MTESPLSSFTAQCQARVEAALERCLPKAEIQPGYLHAAMRYAALGGGKRIRPTLVYATAQAIGLAPERVDAPACAVELIHAYSLVHDDLPAMDDDDLRRGRLTCHKAFDEATAILAGDALQTLAFQTLASAEGLSVESRLAMVDALARASGSRGMVGGQAMDLAAEGQTLDRVSLESIHIHKTGALIRAGVQMATQALPGLDPQVAQRLDHYAKCLGLAFQIRDDILDVEGETAVIGKTQGKDQDQNKATYPALLGLAGAKEAAATLIDDALESLAGLDPQASAPLRWLADYMVQRDH